MCYLGTFFERESEHGWREGAEGAGEGEFQAESLLSVQPNAGSIPGPLDQDASRK